MLPRMDTNLMDRTEAVALGAHNIRIFTGNHRSADATPEQWARATRCLQELCDAAAEHGTASACPFASAYSQPDPQPGLQELNAADGL